jgi:hypothetical protein
MYFAKFWQSHMYPIHARCLSHNVILDFDHPDHIAYSVKYKLWSSSLRNFLSHLLASVSFRPKHFPGKCLVYILRNTKSNSLEPWSEVWQLLTISHTINLTHFRLVTKMRRATCITSLEYITAFKYIKWFWSNAFKRTDKHALRAKHCVQDGHKKQAYFQNNISQ